MISAIDDERRPGAPTIDEAPSSFSSRAPVFDVLLAAGALLVPGEAIEDDERLCDATNELIPCRGRGIDWEAFRVASRVAIGGANTRRRCVDIDSQI